MVRLLKVKVEVRGESRKLHNEEHHMYHIYS